MGSTKEDKSLHLQQLQQPKDLKMSQAKEATLPPAQQQEQQVEESESELFQRLSAIDKNDLFELTLKQVGGFGTFQVILWCVGLLACFLAAFNHMGIIFIAYAPEHTCIKESVQIGVYPIELEDNSSIFKEPTTKSTDDRCWDGQRPCEQWHYDASLFSSTIVTQFDLVCDRLPLLPVIISSYMIGIIIINTVCGFLSDRFGRRRMALIFSVIHICSSFATSFSTSYGMFMGFHILVGSSIHSVWSCLFVLTAEVVPEPRRVANGAVFNFGWNIGAMLMTLLAFWLRDWSNLQLSFSVISLGLVSIFFLVPESPRWLLQHGQTEQAEINLKTIAKRNRVKLENTSFDIHFKVLKERHFVAEKDHIDDKDESFSRRVQEYVSTGLQLLKQREFCKRLLLMSIVWLTVGCSSYGIHFSAKFVGYNVFVTTAIKEVVVIITILILVPIYERSNRALCIMIFYIVGGLLGISFLLLPFDATTTRVILYVLCQAVMSGDFYLVDTYTPDMFSTDTRNFAFSLLDAISKCGTTISPFIVDLGGDKNPNVPPAVFGILMVVASVAFFFTPDTRGQALVQTVQDLETIKGRSIYASCKRKMLRRETLV